MELEDGTIYLCSDDSVRRLDKVEDEFLYYSVPIGRIGTPLHWMKLTRTKRYLIEERFLNGKQIMENEVDKY